jgi:hypothetical protein
MTLREHPLSANLRKTGGATCSGRDARVAAQRLADRSEPALCLVMGELTETMLLSAFWNRW